MTNTTIGENDLKEKPTPWWSYVLPFVSFLLLVEVSGRVGDDLAPWMLLVRVVVPLVMLLFFCFRGEYPELRIAISKWTPLDVALGVALAAMWIVPYVVFPGLRPDESSGVFDPAMAGETWVPFVLSLRMLGYAVVTPWMEEIFMRSFLMRYVDVFDSDKDFRTVPIATFSWRSFAVVTGVFLATHQMWEWWVMLPWAIVTSLWFYYRKDLFALIVVHAATNAAILLAAIFLSDRFPDGSGGTLPLWFFV